MLKYLITVATLFSSQLLLAQQDVEMADTMRAEGKIYVVVAILVLILAGLIGYLVILDKKVTRLENRISERK